MSESEKAQGDVPPRVQMMGVVVKHIAENVAQRWADQKFTGDPKLNGLIQVMAGMRLVGMLAPAAGYTKEQYHQLTESAWNVGVQMLKGAVHQMTTEEREILERDHPLFQQEKTRKEILAREEVQELQVEVPASVRVPVLEELGKEEGR